MRAGSGRRAAVGLDIGSGAVRAAVVEVGPGRGVVNRVGQVALPPGVVSEGQIMQRGPVITALRGLRRSLGIRQRRAILGCEQIRTFVREVELPWVPSQRRASALPLLAADLLPTSPDDAVVDFVELGQSEADDRGRTMRGVLVAASAEGVAAEIAAAEAAGFSIPRVDLSAFALIRSLSADGGSAEGAPEGEALVDVGTGMTTVVVHEHGLPRFVRLLPAADSGVLARLIEDIRSSIDYHLVTEPDATLSRVAITGARTSGELVDGLREVLRVPVVAESAFRNVDVARVGLSEQQIAVMSVTGAVCVGLALADAK